MGSPRHTSRWKSIVPGTARAAMLSVALGMPILTGCETTPRGTSSTEEIHHHNWWNYYRRGTTRLANHDDQGAREDFERALGIRSGARFGYDTDQWRVRTYGMHYLEDYFPNREYGITLYLQQEYTQAERYLQSSLEQTPSGRAKFYLNLVRRELLRSSDPAPPLIKLAAQTKELWTRERARKVEGVASGAARVEQLRIQAKPLFIELAEEELGFSAMVDLRSGRNRVRVEAVDLLGHTAVREVDWIADWQPPQLIIRESFRERGEWVLEGVCRDDHGLRSVIAGHTAVDIPSPEQGARVVEVRITLTDDGPALFEAEDLAGNRLERLLSVEDLHEANMQHGIRQFAQNRSAGVLDTGSASVASGNNRTGSRSDGVSPMLDLSVSGDQLVVYGEEFFLDGKAHDPGGLADLLVNGESLMTLEDRGTAQPYYYARRIPLSVGTNMLEVVAVDLAGNEMIKNLRIVRKDPDYLDAEYRLTVGVPPLRASDDVLHLVERISSNLEEELYEDPVRFHLVERDEGWAYILRELNISRSDLADPAAALRIRRMLPAELLLMGRVASEAGGVTVYVKVVETQDKGRVLFEEDVYSEDLSRDLPSKLEGLVMKVEQRFPLVSGKVVTVSRGGVDLDVGASHGVRSGMGFIVLEPGEDAASISEAHIRRKGSNWITVAARRVGKDTCKARPSPAGSEGSIRPGDYVHAR